MIEASDMYLSLWDGTINKLFNNNSFTDFTKPMKKVGILNHRIENLDIDSNTIEESIFVDNWIVKGSMPFTVFRDVTFSFVTLSEVNLDNTRFHKCTFVNSIITHCDMKECVLQECKLIDSSLIDNSVSDKTFDEVILTNSVIVKDENRYDKYSKRFTQDS